MKTKSKTTTTTMSATNVGTMPARVAPSADEIGAIADRDTSAEIAKYDKRTEKQAGIDYANLPQSNLPDADLGARLVPESPTDALAAVAVRGMNTSIAPTNLSARPQDARQFGANAPDAARVSQLASERNTTMQEHVAAHHAVAVDVVDAAMNPRR